MAAISLEDGVTVGIQNPWYLLTRTSRILGRRTPKPRDGSLLILQLQTKEIGYKLDLFCKGSEIYLSVRKWNEDKCVHRVVCGITNSLCILCVASLPRIIAPPSQVMWWEGKANLIRLLDP